MELIQYIMLGVLQGLTEFLPVSSSGHLVIAQSLVKGFQQPGLLFDIFVHLATFCAVLIYFRKKIFTLIKALIGFVFLKYRVTYFENKNMLWGVIVASIPTAIIGLYFNGISEVLFSSTTYVGYALIFTSLLLVFSDRVTARGNIDTPKSLLVGIMQGLAVIPGISRSGSTIAVALFLNVKREEAAEFSFIMALPAVFGATLLQAKHIGSLDSLLIFPYLMAMIAAFFSGLFAIFVMMKLVKKARLVYFAVYCLILGIITIIWL